MSDKMALRVAIDLLHVPSQVRLVRSEPLPRGVPVLLRIAAGDDAAEREAADLTAHSRDVVRRAAAFFIEQILFAPDTDSYRVLGAAPQASAGELRGNAALLLKWLHHLSKAKWSLSNLASMLRLNLFTYRDLRNWLDNPFETPPLIPETEQLTLELT